MSLWLYLQLPRLALECLPHRPECPAVVLEHQRVITANDVALAAGIKPGQSGATVRTLLGATSLQILERDPAREVRALEQLKCWAYSITPPLECWRKQGLQLEIGGCLRLHGGIEQLIGNAQTELLQRGFTSRVGLAPNRHAAELLSDWEDSPLHEAERNLEQRLNNIPLALLSDVAISGLSKTLASLEKAGIQTLGEIFSMSSRTLGHHCGQAFQQWLDEVTSTRDDVTRDFQPPKEFHDSLWFGFEVRNQVELHPAMQKLLQALTGFSRATQHQTTCIEWQMLRLQGATETFTVRSSEAHNKPELWFELSRLSLEKYTLGSDIEGLDLHARDFNVQQGATSDLFGEAHHRESLHNLVDRLRSRLGLQAVNQIAPREAHLPEFSQYLTQDTGELPTPCTGQAQRPIWLFDEPNPVRLEAGVLFWNGPLSLVLGPERLEDNWWQEPASRDYYVAQTEAGQSVWLFQNRHTKQWYIQGIMP